MPGLVGFCCNENSDGHLLRMMTNSLRHEERYQIDTYQDPHAGIARIHLGIFNPRSQPIFNEDGTLLIFFDGKIYGYEQDLEDLERRGHTFKLKNDPEFCLHSYEEHGKDFVKKLNGNFTLLIYHLCERKIVLANDRFGFRVHYYAINDGRLLFSPEPKAILEDSSFKRELNEMAVAEYFAFGECWNYKTFFKGIEVLPPASILTYENGKILLQKYWDLEYVPDYRKSEEEFVEDLVRTFRHAVEIRMRDNLRHGVTLSGGLDSRAIIGGMDSDSRKNATAITFGSEDCDEARIAHMVVVRMGLKEHLILEPTPQNIIENAERDIRLTDGRLFMGLSFVNPMFQIFREKVDVIFDGFAMDLTLGGSYLTKEKVRCRSKERLFDILSKKRLFTDLELEGLFTEEFHEKVKEVPMQVYRQEFEKTKSGHPGNFSDELAMNTHVAWMHIGDVAVRDELEVSHPSSDNDFIDVLVRIPPEWRLNHRIYRKFLIKLAPELAGIPYNRTNFRADAPLVIWWLGTTYLKGREFVKKRIHKYTKKRLFLPNKRSYVNYDEWFRTDERWRVYFTDMLLRKDTQTSVFINQTYVEKLMDEQEAIRKSNSMKLLQIASFKLFMRLYF
jgi:asparagine synthase (glutamine-hydrolysing)